MSLVHHANQALKADQVYRLNREPFLWMQAPRTFPFNSPAADLLMGQACL